MAYEIISQNNTVTTLADENGNVIRVPSRAVLASGTTFSVTEVNNNLATLTDSNGTVYRDVPCVAVLYGGSGGDAVDSVNGKTGAVVLDASDVGAIPQISTMPAPSASNEGQIVQYKGTTTDTYTNGYIYKSVQETEHTIAIAFEDPDISFDSAHSEALVKAIEDVGAPNYWQRIDTVEVWFVDTDNWFVSLIDSARSESLFWKENVTSAEMADLGFILPATDPQPDTRYSGTVTWSTASVRKWINSDTGAYIPVYTELPAPSADNVGLVALYMGEDIKIDMAGPDILKGRIYKVEGLYQPNYEIGFSGGSGWVANMYNYERFLEKVDSETGTIVFTATVSGSDVIWSTGGDTVNLSDYGIIVLGTATTGNSITINWNGYGLQKYNWMPLSASQSPAENPVIESGEWDVNNYAEVYAKGVTESNTVIVGPAPESADDYAQAGILCIGQGLDTLTFICKTTPVNDIELSIAII